MTVGKADATKWFFGFRQTSPKPPGKWVAEGPYDTLEQAEAARKSAKAWDAEVSPLFAASSKAEAQDKCDSNRIL